MRHPAHLKINQNSSSIPKPVLLCYLNTLDNHPHTVYCLKPILTTTTTTPQHNTTQQTAHVSTPNMDLLILVAVFIGSNFWGMYGQVPLINIDPSNTFLERLVGAFQLTSVAYALQEIHPLVFPEAALDTAPTSQSPVQSLPPKTEPFQTVMEYANMTAPPEARGSGRKGSRFVLEDLEMQNHYGEYLWKYIAPAVIVALAVFGLVWLSKSTNGGETDSEQEEDEQTSSHGVVMDKVLLRRLVDCLESEFRNRPERMGDGATSIMGILGLIKIKMPPGAANDDNPRLYNTLLQLSKRVAKIEKGFTLAFPVGTFPVDDSSSQSESGQQAPGQGAYQKYKDEFDKNLKQIDEGMKNYNNIANEVNEIKASFKDLQNQVASLYRTMAPVEESDGEEEVSEGEKGSARRYADDIVKRSNAVWETKYDYLNNRLAELIDYIHAADQDKKSKLHIFEQMVYGTFNSLQQETDSLKKAHEHLNRQAGTFITGLDQKAKDLDQRIKELSRIVNYKLTDPATLLNLGDGLTTTDPYLIELTKMAQMSTKGILLHERSLKVHRDKIEELMRQVPFLQTSVALLTTENEKLWDIIESANLGSSEETSRGAGKAAKSSRLLITGPDGDSNNSHVTDSKADSGNDDKGEPSDAGPKGASKNVLVPCFRFPEEVDPNDLAALPSGNSLDSSPDLEAESSERPDNGRKRAPKGLIIPSLARPGVVDLSEVSPSLRTDCYYREADPHGFFHPDYTIPDATGRKEVNLYDSESSESPLSPKSLPRRRRPNTQYNNILTAVREEGPVKPKRGETVAGRVQDDGKQHETKEKTGGIDTKKPKEITAPSQPKGKPEGVAVPPDQLNGKAPEGAKTGKLKQTAVQEPKAHNDKTDTRLKEKLQTQHPPDVAKSGVKPSSPQEWNNFAATARFREKARNEKFVAELEKQRTPVAAPKDSSPKSAAVNPNMELSSRNQTEPRHAAAPAGTKQQHPETSQRQGQARPGNVSERVSQFQSAAREFDATAYGVPKGRKTGHYPPAGSKRDYQPSTPKGVVARQKDKKCREVERRPIGQQPPVRESASAEEQQKIQAWGSFSAETAAKEKLDNEKLLEEARKNNGPASATWKEKVTWRQSGSSPAGSKSKEEPGANQAPESRSQQSPPVQDSSAPGSAGPQAPGAGQDDTGNGDSEGDGKNKWSEVEGGNGQNW